MAYSPKYVTDLSDIPYTGPDKWSKAEKKKALKIAESKFEADVNGGNKLGDDRVEAIHQSAVNALTTHILTNGLSEPTSQKLGDLSDDGGQIMKYASQHKDLYNSLIGSIKNAEDDSSSGNHTIFTA